MLNNIKELLKYSDWIEYKFIRKFIGGEWVKIKCIDNKSIFNDLKFWIDCESYTESQIKDTYYTIDYENYDTENKEK